MGLSCDLGQITSDSCLSPCAGHGWMDMPDGCWDWTAGRETSQWITNAYCCNLSLDIRQDIAHTGTRASWGIMMLRLGLRDKG